MMQELLEAMGPAAKTDAEQPRSRTKREKRGGGIVGLIAAAVAAAVVCGGAVAGGLVPAPATENARLGRTVGSVHLYSAPDAAEAATLDRTSYFSLLDTSKQQETVWYEVLVPVDGVLKKCYLTAQDAEILDSGASSVLLERLR